MKVERVPLLGAGAVTSWDSIIKTQGRLSNSASAGSIQESPHLVRLDLFLSRPTARKKYYLIMFLGIKSSVDDMTKLLRKKNLKNIEE